MTVRFRALIISAAVIATMGQGARAGIDAGNGRRADAHLQKIYTDFAPHFAYPGAPDDHMTLSGRVRMADGSPLPADLRLELSNAIGINTSTNQRLNLAEGTFTATVPVGVARLRASTQSGATLLAGPFTAAPGATLEGLDLVIQPGVDLRIKAADADGKPIAHPRSSRERSMCLGASHLPRRTPFPVDAMTGKFLITPLPLGGRYAILASKGNGRAYSTAITVDAAHFAVRHDLVLPLDPPIITGKITLPDGHPLANRALALGFMPDAPDFAHTFKDFGRIWTGPDGTFSIRGLNPVPGTVQLAWRANDGKTLAQWNFPVNSRELNLVVETAP